LAADVYATQNGGQYNFDVEIKGKDKAGRFKNL